MKKPLWKFLEDGGWNAILDYGEISPIKNNSNCCSWATGDLLNYDFFNIPHMIGRNTGFTSKKEHFWNPKTSPLKFMQRYFTRNLMNCGLTFLGLGDKIPETDREHYIIAAFHRDEQLNPNFHFIRQHNNDLWSHRPGICREITQMPFDTPPKTIHDFTEHMSRYTIFKGWYSVPKRGVQSGIDAAIYTAYNSMGTTKKRKMSVDLKTDIESLADFYKRKNYLLNNIESLEQLKSDYVKLAMTAPNQLNESLIYKVLMRYNKNRYPNIINSPQRNLLISKHK